MQIKIGLENGIEGRSLAWALDFPGCFAYGVDGQDAVLGMARAIPDYISWMAAHTTQPWFKPETIDIRLVDVFEVFYVDDNLDRAEGGYEVNAWFQSDWKPLQEEAVQHGLELLNWTRADLLAIYNNLSEAELSRSRGEGEYTLAKILRHIGTAEWWYLDRLGMAGDKKFLPADTWERLSYSRSLLRDALPALIGREQVVGIDGEFWSPRKLLRRVVWHEVDHIQHARKVLSKAER